MDSPIKTWHYGLIARWWAEFNREAPELDFFRSVIKESGQPVLDLGCGTGRLLLPLLAEGIDVDGCDVSPDMLEFCRSRARAEGVEVSLFTQPMHQFDLPRRYRTIFMCRAFAHGGDRNQDRECLRRCHQQVVPGGMLAFDLDVPYADPNLLMHFLPEKRAKLPAPWPEKGNRRKSADANELELRTRLVDLDPLEQQGTMAMRAFLWRDEELLEQEERELQASLYFKNEVLLLLELTGFEDLQVYGGYQRKAPTAEDDWLTYVARKPRESREF